jgi:cell wall-associated NlpC family hydrolase
MQRFQSVLCRMSHDSSPQSSAQTIPSQSQVLLHQLQRIINSAPQAGIVRSLRYGVATLLVPMAMLSGSAPSPSLEQRSAQDVAVFSAVPTRQFVSGTIGVLDTSYKGKIALGAPQPSDEQAPRVATPSHDAAELALRYVGARYRYGGSSPGGFDCSGLTMYVYSQLGVDLPHKASAQINERFGQRVETIESLAPGDLVFFQRTTRARGITHVALYVGDGMMVSANSPKTGVQHVSIHNTYWRSRFVAGLRPYR